MREAGYGPDKPLKIKVSTRNIAPYRDPAVILIDQLKQIYIDGELEMIDTAVFLQSRVQKDYALALNLTGSSLDDPDQHFFENYGCGSLRNYTDYCNPELDEEIRRAVDASLIRRSAAAWCGTSSASWPRTSCGRSSATTSPRPAGSRRSRT